MSELRILLIEDSLADAVLTQRALEGGDGARFALTVAKTLREGIERLAAQGFDAILLDLTLPDSLGPETVTRMRAAARELPIVVLSGAEDPATVDRCLRAGARAFREKGRIDSNDLQDILRRAIEGRRSVVDFSNVLSQLGDDREALREIVAAYVIETRENLERLPTTIASGAWHEVRRLAHTTKSAMRAFGAVEAHALAQSLEQLADMDDRSPAAELFSRMKSAVEGVVAVLARFSETGVLDTNAPR